MPRFLEKAMKYRKAGSLNKTVRNRIALSIIRRTNYPEKTFTSPFWVMIEPTSHCNLKCTMCPRTMPGAVHGNMSFDQYKNIFDQFKHATHLRIQGLGEPFLNKDIFRMIEYTKDRGVMTELYSNGTFITDELAQKIFNSGLNEIRFSLDGATKETYEKIRINANFEKVLSNIKNFVNLRNKIKHPIKVKIAVVAMIENYNELSKFVDIALDLGVDGIGIQMIQYKFEIGNSNHEQLEAISKYKESIKGELDGVFELAKSHNLEITIPTMEPNNAICEWAWSGIYITWNGNVLPCLAIYDRVMGNIMHERFSKIWNNENYRDFRRGVSRRQELPRQCVGCTFFIKHKTWIPSPSNPDGLQVKTPF